VSQYNIYRINEEFFDWANKGTTSHAWVNLNDPKIVFELILPQKSRRMRWPDMWHILESGAIYSRFCCGNPGDGDQLEDLSIYGSITLE
jgi:hypothetical protein